jgi:hypothetical protein
LLILPKSFNMIGKEFTFDVDMSQLGCGLNGERPCSCEWLTGI